ncbi:MAG: hypothetical protein R3B09_15605 [Nannocystaceae bacterium]
MRRSLIALVVGGLALVTAAGDAAAQQCHQFTGDVWRQPGIALLPSVRIDAAGYHTPSYEGDYQGIAPALTFVHPRALVMAMMPAYRLQRNGAEEYGVGDLAVATRIPVPPWSLGRLRAGFGLAATLPTGSALHGLGMGHVMLMPEFWWRSDHGPLQIAGTAGFGRALARFDGEAHQHGPAPLVNPMNMSEIEGSIAAFARVHPRLALRTSFYGAVPAGSARANDRSRLIMAEGVVIDVGKLEISVDLQLGLVGRPFLARGVVQVGYRFDLPTKGARAGRRRAREARPARSTRAALDRPMRCALDPGDDAAEVGT